MDRDTLKLFACLIACYLLIFVVGAIAGNLVIRGLVA